METKNIELISQKINELQGLLGVENHSIKAKIEKEKTRLIEGFNDNVMDDHYILLLGNLDSYDDLLFCSNFNKEDVFNEYVKNNGCLYLSDMRDFIEELDLYAKQRYKLELKIKELDSFLE